MRTLAKLEDKKEVLHSCNLTIKQGQKVCIIGTEGSGKSMLLLSILGESSLDTGTCCYNGKISYLNMKYPLWLTSRSILENITMEENYNKQKYLEILHVVGLNVDKFENSSLTLILNNADNFNSSEKRKILIARCLYNEADIYMFDGVFDFIDNYERKELFTRVVLKYLQNKTVIFTNTERLLARLSDRILVMDKGVIEEDGHIDEIDKKSESLFADIINSDNFMQFQVTGFSKMLERVEDSAIDKSSFEFDQKAMEDADLGSMEKSKHFHE